MSITQTVIQVLSASSALNNKFLKVPAQGALPQDVGAKLVSSQADATLFNVPNTVYGFIPGFEAVGSSTGPAGDNSVIYTAFTDLLAHAQPVLFSTSDQLSQEPFAGNLGCNLFTDPQTNNEKRKLGCATNANASFNYGSGFAICNYVNNNFGDLFIYDSDFYNNAAPPGCTEVLLKIIGNGS